MGLLPLSPVDWVNSLDNEIPDRNFKFDNSIYKLNIN